MELGLKLEFAKRNRKCFISGNTLKAGELCLVGEATNGYGTKKVSYCVEIGKDILEKKIKKYEALIDKATFMLYDLDS